MELPRPEGFGVPPHPKGGTQKPGAVHHRCTSVRSKRAERTRRVCVAEKKEKPAHTAPPT